MSIRRVYLLIGALLTVHTTASSCPVLDPQALYGARAPIKIIFDTDMWSDIDDALALAMLHALQDRNEVDLLAVTISTDEAVSSSYVDLVNTFYRHPGIPIGIARGGRNAEYFLKTFPETSPWTRYTELVSEQKNRDGSPVYRHRLIEGSKVPEAMSLLRKTLTAQPDRSVVIIQVGYSTNLARLLDSKPDSASPLYGRDLIKRKVRLLSIMAGVFGEVRHDGKVIIQKGGPETNLIVDVPAAQNLFSSWPTPIIASGIEIGVAMPYPGESVEQDYAYVERHPIAETYRIFCEERKATNLPQIKQCPRGFDKPTCDLTSVLYAARPDRNYFSLSKPGRITVLEDGSSRFDQSEGGTHRYLILSDEQKARTLEAMVMLASQPPRRATSQ